MKSRFNKHFLGLILVVACCILPFYGCKSNEATETQEVEEVEKVEYQLPDIEWTDYYGKEQEYSKTDGILYYDCWKGPKGIETYYTQNVDYSVRVMRAKGFSEEEYPYWVDEAGFRRLGNYIICAANFEEYPRGTLIEGELGTYIVCETGDAFKKYPDRIDVATDWERYRRWLLKSKEQ